MRRREFISLLGGTAVAWPLAARAQQPSAKVFRIGFLGTPTADSLPKRLEAFRAGLRDLGYREGRDFVIEYRWAEDQYDRLPALLADLIRLRVDVIVTHGTPAALAAKQATTTMPIVVAVVADALGSGIVSSLARPGGNVTGLTFFGHLNRSQLRGTTIRIPYDRDFGKARNGFFQKFQQFRSKFGKVKEEASYIAARARQAGNHTSGDRVGLQVKRNDGSGGCGSPNGKRCGGCDGCDNVNILVYQFNCHWRKSRWISVSET